MKRNQLVFTTCIAAMVLMPGVERAADAALIGTRAQLVSQLIGGGTTEDFEAYSIATTSSNNIGTTYDATSTPNGQGPNLVVPGIRFTRPSNNLQIYGTTFLGGNSQRLGWDGNLAAPVTFDFLSPTTGFGVDLLTGFNSTGPTTVTIFAPDDTTVLATFPGIVLNANPQVPVFFGFEDAGGIGRATFSLASGGPIFDNVTFGQIGLAVPEPATALLGLLGLGGLMMRRRRAA